VINLARCCLHVMCLFDVQWLTCSDCLDTDKIRDADGNIFSEYHAHTVPNLYQQFTTMQDQCCIPCGRIPFVSSNSAYPTLALQYVVGHSYYNSYR
jgi:hypothetical protein